jgi:hypothetical protein
MRLIRLEDCGFGTTLDIFFRPICGWDDTVGTDMFFRIVVVEIVEFEGGIVSVLNARGPGPISLYLFIRYGFLCIIACIETKIRSELTLCPT